jgi:ribosomal protein L29
MKAKDIRLKTKSELEKLAAETGAALVKVRLGSAPQGKNTNAGKNLRRDLARILTAITRCGTERVARGA